MNKLTQMNRVLICTLHSRHFLLLLFVFSHLQCIVWLCEGTGSLGDVNWERLGVWEVIPPRSDGPRLARLESVCVGQIIVFNTRRLSLLIEPRLHSFSHLCWRVAGVPGEPVSVIKYWSEPAELCRLSLWSELDMVCIAVKCRFCWLSCCWTTRGLWGLWELCENSQLSFYPMIQKIEGRINSLFSLFSLLLFYLFGWLTRNSTGHVSVTTPPGAFQKPARLCLLAPI